MHAVTSSVAIHALSEVRLKFMTFYVRIYPSLSDVDIGLHNITHSVQVEFR